MVKKPAQAQRCPTCKQVFSGDARFCPFDGDALAEAPDWNPAADPLIGQVVEGRYEVIGVLGEGGMGTVYEVRHVTLGRRFALKVLRRDIADAEHSARFIQEAKAAAAVGHPNIVAVSDFGELALPAPAESGERVPFFVMEYLSGISLAELLRAEKTLDATRTAQIVLQCAAGLSAAHATGVVHRDLKPDNIFLTRNGDREFVKLLDFGVAKIMGAGRLTRAGMVFGTPHYMSPEQAAGQSVDLRADIYALGVILYECLAGHVPFEADTYMGVLTKHMFATPEPIDRAVPDASRLGALGPVVMRCLAKSPQDRYASMAELCAALEAVLEGASRRAAVSRSGTRSRGSAMTLDPPKTPGLRPVVGPIGVGLGIVAAGLVGLLAIRELRSHPAESSAAATVSAPAPPPSASGVATIPVTADTAPTTTAAATATVTAPTATAGAPPTPAQKPRPGSGRPSEPRRHSGGDVVDPWSR
ncbi:Serine/threonine-protein kinase pkn3 [Minicystis rosea]|nr:Serine/threonine-protein kinase pkn3 [Minicystis rosea]